jgi:hypothetical protein
MDDNGYATSTIDHAWSYLNQACQNALRHRKIKTNPNRRRAAADSAAAAATQVAVGRAGPDVADGGDPEGSTPGASSPSERWILMLAALAQVVVASVLLPAEQGLLAAPLLLLGQG